MSRVCRLNFYRLHYSGQEGFIHLHFLTYLQYVYTQGLDSWENIILIWFVTNCQRKFERLLPFATKQVISMRQSDEVICNTTIPMTKLFFKIINSNWLTRSLGNRVYYIPCQIHTSLHLAYLTFVKLCQKSIMKIFIAN